MTPFRAGLYVVIITVFLFTRLTFLGSGLNLVEPDENYWHAASQGLRDSLIPNVYGKPIVNHSPLFEYLAYWVSFLVPESQNPESYESTRIVSIICSGLLACLMYIYLKRKVSETVALYSLILFTTTPIILFYSKIGLHESILMLAAFTFFVAYERVVKTPSPHTIMLAGLALGFAVAAKNTGLIFFAAPIFNSGFLCCLSHNSLNRIA